MDLQELIKQAQDESEDPKVRLERLEELKQHDDPEALTVLVRGCFARNKTIVQYCQSVMKELPVNKFQSILDCVLNGDFGPGGQKFLQLLDALRGSDVMSYILSALSSKPAKGEQYQQLARWLRGTGMIDKYLHTLLKLPPQSAKNGFILLTRLDSKVPTYLANLTSSFSPQMNLKVLTLLEQLNWGSEVALLLIIRKFIEHDHPTIRARSAYLVGRTLQNIRFLRHVLRDPVPEVRLSAIRSIIKSESKTLPLKIVDLLYTALGDRDGRVRAKAAQVLYIHKDVKGLRMLISMLDCPTPIERAYAVHLLGELQEISVRDKLQEMAQDEQDKSLRAEALKALEILDGEIDVLTQQFDELDGTLTRYLISEDKESQLLLWDRLEDLDRAAIAGMLRSIGLAPETTQQLMNVVNQVGGHGMTLPLLLATIVDEDGKVNNRKAVDLNRMKAEATKIVQQLQSGKPDAEGAAGHKWGSYSDEPTDRRNPGYGLATHLRQPAVRAFHTRRLLHRAEQPSPSSAAKSGYQRRTPAWISF